MGTAQQIELSELLRVHGFFCAFGTTETYRGRHKFFMRPVHRRRHVRKGRPFTWNQKNGVVVIYDANGWPWVRLTKDLRNNNRMWLTIQNESGYDLFHNSQKITLGVAAHVPHANDKGRFLNVILPKLLK